MMLGSVRVYSGWISGGDDARDIMHGSANRRADKLSCFVAQESIKFIISSSLVARDTMFEYKKCMALLSPPAFGR